MYSGEPKPRITSYNVCYTKLLRHPLVVVGGPCAGNPEPLADFFDCAVIGDGEEAVVELCAALRSSRAAGENRAALLKRLAQIEGLYVPSLFEVRYRITSYNVCYTKLLRYILIDNY